MALLNQINQINSSRRCPASILYTPIVLAGESCVIRSHRFYA
jgi:hypothetical protein